MKLVTVIMKKIKKDTTLVYYSVSTIFEGIKCYIGIDPLGNKVLFFSDAELKEPIGSIDFNMPDNLHEIPGIELLISNRVAFFVYKAIQNKIFLDEMVISN